MSNQYAIGRVVGCERIAPYRHDLLGSLVCNLNLLARVSGTLNQAVSVHICRVPRVVSCRVVSCRVVSCRVVCRTWR
jgi:hypothetical protein